MLSKNTNLVTINGGSSSIKFAMYKMAENPGRVFYGSITRIGSTNEVFTVTSVKGNKKKKLDIYAPGFYQAAVFMLNWLEEQPGFDQVECIGHRIVHGSDHAKPEIIDSALLKELKQIRAYDLDHLPAEIEIIELFKMRYPSLLQVACFDTSFHSTMPRMARLLAIPRRFDRAGIRRYGFHGLSYDYLMEKLRKTIGTDAANGRIVLAHLGNGEASITAVKEGKSIDTSMGFTPTGGLMMGTRSGDLDPGGSSIYNGTRTDGGKTIQLSHQSPGRSFGDFGNKCRYAGSVTKRKRGRTGSGGSSTILLSDKKVDRFLYGRIGRT